MQIRGLKKKIIFVVITVYVVIGFATLLAFQYSSSRIIEGLALSFATKEAILDKTKIASLLDREAVIARKMADDNQLRQWADNENDPVLRRRAFDALDSYRKFFRDKSYSVTLKGSNRYYVYTPREKGLGGLKTDTLNPENPSDKWFYESLRTVEDYAMNLDFNRTIQESKVWINVIMRNAHGEKTGICSTGINITDFLNEIIYSNENGLSVMLTDSSGVIQAHKDRSIVEQNANARDNTAKINIFNQVATPADRQRLQDIMERLASGKSEVEAFPVTLGNTHYLTAVSFMPHIGWFNIVQVDASKVISMKAFFPMIAILFLSLLLVVATITLLINRMVLAPLLKLTTASRTVADGRYDITLPVTSQDEIGDLTGTFNTMTTTILDYTTKLEEKVRERTLELSEVNTQLEESRVRIMESINYARIIQESILPGQELLDRCLGEEHFVLYRPKETVGGDFYYIREFPNHFLLACVDCTGHGVPGAFVTMTVSAVLNQVIDLSCNNDPARILSELNLLLQQSMKQCKVDSGLDISICLVDRESQSMVFAGAVLSLYIVSNGILREIKGNNRRVGYRHSKMDFKYDTHVIRLSSGDTFYLTTDGILDLPTGKKRYGLGSERFRKMLAEHAGMPMNRQMAIFEQLLEEYQGSNPPRDDITMVGFRIQ